MGSLFKRAAVRGINHELIRQGVISFPSKEAADEAADAVADQMPEQPQQGPQGPMPGSGPEISGPEGHSPEEVAAIANKLIEIAHALMQQAGAGGPPAEAAAKMGAETLYKAAAEITANTYSEVAEKTASDLMAKAKEEAEKQAGSLIQGGDKGNKPEQAAKVTEIGALDQKNRPAGAYQVPMGSTDLDTNKGNIGAHEKHDKQPGESPSGSNSLTSDVGKKASESLRAQISKIAGSLIQGGDKGNSAEQAAKVTEIGKLDQKNRPGGYATVSPGGANFSEPQSARIGLEKKPDVMPSNTPGGTNSVIQASKAAAEYPPEFMAIFNKTAADVGPYLPGVMSEEQKVAAVRHMMGMDHDERQSYISSLHDGLKSAGAVSEKIEALKGDESKKHESKETKAEEKKEEGKKESALLDTIRAVATAPAQ